MKNFILLKILLMSFLFRTTSYAAIENEGIIFGTETGNTTFEKSILNNGIIKNVGDSDVHGTLNGVTIPRDKNNIDITNMGIISGKNSSNSSGGYLYNTGNGIDSSTFDSTNNKGVTYNMGIISGKISRLSEASFYGSGNGISIYSAMSPSYLTSVINEGTISGKAINIKHNEHVGNAISLYGSSDAHGTYIEKILNKGILDGTALSNQLDDLIIEDNGRFSVQSLRGSGNGINIYENYHANSISSLIESSNDGIIRGKVNIEAGNVKYEGNSDRPNLRTGLSSTSIGNGIGIYANRRGTATLGNLSNKGLISGYANLESGKINTLITPSDIVNTTTARSIIRGTGNGISVYGDYYSGADIHELINYGTVSGFLNHIPGEINGLKEVEEIKNSGHGISSTGFLHNFVNEGTVKGSSSAVATSAPVVQFDNYGILAGREIFSDGLEVLKNQNSSSSFIEKELGIMIPSAGNNYGIYINLKDEILNGKKTGKVEIDSQGDVVIESIENGVGSGASGKNILNAFVNGNSISGYDSYENVSSDNSFNNYFINGSGIKNGVLNILDNVVVNLSNTIVNAYKTAITLNNNSTLNATDTIFNGGGLKNEDPVIVALKNESNIILKGNSIVNGSILFNEKNANLELNDLTVVNGDILLKGSDSIVTVDNSVKINGDILAESSGVNNKIQIGTGTQGELNIFGNVKNFSNIGVTGNVTFFETAKINSGDINITNGRLLVRVDGTEKDSEGRVIGHSLYGHNGKITADNAISLGARALDQDAVLIFKASGLGVGTTIALKDDLGNVTDISSLTNKQLGTYSLVHTATKKDTGNVLIDIENWEEIIEDIQEDGSITEKPEIDDVEEIGEIYDSIKNSGQINELAATTDLSDGRESFESLAELVSLLDQIYANNPYSYGGLMSKYSSDMFREGIYSSYSRMPEAKEYISTGQSLYSYNQFRDVKETNTFGKEKYDNKYSTTSNTTGLLGTVEYGIKNNESIGFAIGGAKQKLNMSNNSDLKGDVVYLGVFHKKNIDKFKFTTGLGYQYNMYESNRNIYNKYQSFKNEGDFDTNLFNVYSEMKYTMLEDKGIKIEPKARVSYTYVKQDSVSEKDSKLSIDVNKANYNYVDTEIGIDAIKEIPVSKGKVQVIANVGYVNSQGTSNKELTGKMKNSTDFGIKGQLLNENNGKAGIRVEYEKDNGMFYSVGADITFSSQNQRNVNARVGIGYKF